MSMFNADQRDHMRAMASLPPEKKCRCGWFARWDCYRCNVKEFLRLGGKEAGRGYTLPDGKAVGYGELIDWIKAQEAPHAR